MNLFNIVDLLLIVDLSTETIEVMIIQNDILGYHFFTKQR